MLLLFSFLVLTTPCRPFHEKKPIHGSWYPFPSPGSGFEEYHRNRLPYIPPDTTESRSKQYPLEPHHLDYGSIEQNYGSMYGSSNYCVVDDRNSSHETMNYMLPPYHATMSHREYIHTNQPRIPDDESQSMNRKTNHHSIMYGPPYTPDRTMSQHPWSYPNHSYNNPIPNWPMPPISIPSYHIEYTSDIRPVDVLSGRGGTKTKNCSSSSSIFTFQKLPIIKLTHFVFFFIFSP
jgi:hypothetical protein